MSRDARQPGVQRRRFPRIELDAPLAATDLATGRAVDILDLSHGGFRTLSPTPGTTGMHHTFRFAVRDGATYDIRAAAVHSHRAPGSTRTFVVGWQAEPGHESRLDQVIADVMTVSAPDDATSSTSADRERLAPTPAGRS